MPPLSFFADFCIKYAFLFTIKNKQKHHTFSLISDFREKYTFIFTIKKRKQNQHTLIWSYFRLLCKVHLYIYNQKQAETTLTNLVLLRFCVKCTFIFPIKNNQKQHSVLVNGRHQLLCKVHFYIHKKKASKNNTHLDRKVASVLDVRGWTLYLFSKAVEVVVVLLHFSLL